MTAAVRPTILLFGAGGQVGHALTSVLPNLGHLVAVGGSATSAPQVDVRERVDLSDGERLTEIVRQVKPDVIVNAAAYTAVDKAESEPERALAVNAAAPGLLAGEAKRLKALLIHYSSDYVYDGSGTEPRRETAPTGPLGVYGLTKLAGDVAVEQAAGDFAILRTSWVVSGHGHNFVKTMLRLGAEREELRVVDDQVGAPTTAAVIADMTARVIARSGAGFPSGIYHLCCSGATSWHGFAEEIFRQARAAGLPLKVRSVARIATKDYPTPARRPLNSRLDCQKFTQTFGLGLISWQEALQPIMTALAFREP